MTPSRYGDAERPEDRVGSLLRRDVARVGCAFELLGARHNRRLARWRMSTVSSAGTLTGASSSTQRRSLKMPRPPAASMQADQVVKSVRFWRSCPPA